ncbi:MAG: hypothetical protein ACP5KN_15020 [Armatimonadota bacterium]
MQTALWDTCGMLQDCARADSLFLPCARVFTAGGIAVFIGRESVMMYLGM